MEHTSSFEIGSYVFAWLGFTIVSIWAWERMLAFYKEAADDLLTWPRLLQCVFSYLVEVVMKCFWIFFHILHYYPRPLYTSSSYWRAETYSSRKEVHRYHLSETNTF